MSLRITRQAIRLARAFDSVQARFASTSNIAFSSKAPAIQKEHEAAKGHQEGHVHSFDGRDWQNISVFEEHAKKVFTENPPDGWRVRQVINELHVIDGLPEISIMADCLRCCRQLNDYALAIRYLEALAYKTGGYNTELWKFIKTELAPTLKELGILTPEEMGYNKPELALKDVYDD